MPTGRGSTLPLCGRDFYFHGWGTNLSPGRAEEAREGSTPPSGASVECLSEA